MHLLGPDQFNEVTTKAVAVAVIRMRLAQPRIEPHGGDGETGFHQEKRIEVVSMAFSGFAAKRRGTREQRLSRAKFTPAIGHAG